MFFIHSKFRFYKFSPVLPDYKENYKDIQKRPFTNAPTELKIRYQKPHAP